MESRWNLTQGQALYKWQVMRPDYTGATLESPDHEFESQRQHKSLGKPLGRGTESPP